MSDRKIIPMTDDVEIPPRRPLTLKDVSEASGVSEMTVSRALRNRGDRVYAVAGDDAPLPTAAPTRRIRR